MPKVFLAGAHGLKSLRNTVFGSVPPHVDRGHQCQMHLGVCLKNSCARPRPRPIESESLEVDLDLPCGQIPQGFLMKLKNLLQGKI